MDDFGTLARDFGFKPQGKSAPMAPPRANVGVGSDGVDRWARSSSSSSSSILDDRNRDGLSFNDVFGGPPKYSSNNNSKSTSSLSEFDYDSIFKSSSTSAANDSKNKPSSPVYDKPVYDEDIFDGLPGLKSKSASSSARYEDNVFAGISSPPNQNQKQGAPLDDFFENLGISEKSELKNNKSSRGLDDLIPGFGGISHPGGNRPISEASRPQKTTVNSSKLTSDVMEDPFVILESTSGGPAVSSSGIFTDPLEEIGKLGNSGKKEVNGPSVSGGAFDDIDPLDGFGKTFPTFSSEINNRVKDGSPSSRGSSMGIAQTSATTEPIGRSSFWDSESHSQKMPADNFQEFHQTVFDMPSVSTDSRKPVHQSASPFVNAKSSEADSQVDVSPESEEQMETSDDVWLTVSEITLFTPPTSAPAPSRPPPPIPARASKSETGFFTSNARKKGNEFSSSPRSTQYSPKPTHPPMKSTVASQIDELEDFAMGRDRNNVDEYADIHSSEEVNNSSAAAASAAAMKEAMDRAEAKFRHAKEVREREYAKTGRSKEAVQLEKDEQAMQDDQDRLDRERRLKEEEERERKRLEKERERARVEREREKARQAVERATREARERAATEARERAAAEARLKSERAAVQRAQAEARERAAAEARERAEKAATDARERANAEAREKAAAASRAEAEARRRAERAAVERAAAEARERAAAEARERAAATAAAARMNQQKNDNDLESFFSMGSRPSSAPRPPRANSSDPGLDPQFQSKGGPEVARRTSSVSSSSGMRKASSTTNIVDDLTSIFGAAASSGEFQEFEGESEERRRARLERHQRTQERAAKALAEKNQRDLQAQREQEERHRMAETLDFEIKRWASGKEGNLRALLSTLQYVLWPECGWQPVSLTDLIAGASVKKFYRKATLCIHPDKVQQKGATLQQKYIAEKVFDLLKEAWNKFNSEELF